MNKRTLAVIFTGAVVAGGIAWMVIKRAKKPNKGKDIVVHLDEPAKSDEKSGDDSDSGSDESDDISDSGEDGVTLEKIQYKRPIPMPNPKDEPFVISEWDYQSDRYSRFNEMALTYYQDDGLLVNNENDIPFDDPVKVVGEEAMWILEQSDEDSVYVHDDSMMMNYEIKIVHGGVYDDVFPDDDE